MASRYFDVCRSSLLVGAPVRATDAALSGPSAAAPDVELDVAVDPLPHPRTNESKTGASRTGERRGGEACTAAQ
jgi:hypothetical protein